MKTVRVVLQLKQSRGLQRDNQKYIFFIQNHWFETIYQQINDIEYDKKL